MNHLLCNQLCIEYHCKYEGVVLYIRQRRSRAGSAERLLRIYAEDIWSTSWRHRDLLGVPPSSWVSQIRKIHPISYNFLKCWNFEIFIIFKLSPGNIDRAPGNYRSIVLVRQSGYGHHPWPAHKLKSFQFHMVKRSIWMRETPCFMD